MLIFEGVSVAVILILAFLALAKTARSTPRRFTCRATGLKDIGLGVVVAIFSLVGFECATAFGEEAKKPLVTIPRAVIASLLLTGAFFVFITYVETHALANNNPTLDQLDAPLTTLVENLGVKWMGVRSSASARWSASSPWRMSCMNAGLANHLHDGPIRHLPDFHRQLAQAQPDAARRDHRVRRACSS